MKKEASVIAEPAGKLTAVYVKAGDSVETKDLIVGIL